MPARIHEGGCVEGLQLGTGVNTSASSVSLQNIMHTYLPSAPAYLLVCQHELLLHISQQRLHQGLTVPLQTRLVADLAQQCCQLIRLIALDQLDKQLMR